MASNKWSESEILQLELIGANCTCTALRRAARAVTRHFDDAYAECGLRSTQTPILLELSLSGPLAMGELATRLVVDKSTLSRNIARLEEQGLVERNKGRGREIVMSISAAGIDRMRQVVPLWQKAQETVMEYIPDLDWENLAATSDKFSDLHASKSNTAE